MSQSVNKWLENLSLQQIRALACQHKLDQPFVRDINKLRSELMVLLAVRKQAGVLDGKTQDLQTS